jgi:SAM-dependent methyltransferase
MAADGRMICNVCESSDFAVLFYGRDYEYGVPGRWKIVRCRCCGLLSQDPVPHASDLGGFYPESYPPYHDHSIISWMHRVVFANDARNIARMLKRDGKILDVGCGNGAAMRALRRRGYMHLCGVEIDAAAAQQARDAGFDVRNGELLDADFADGTFDLIRMGHVIEHVPDPGATLARAWRLLKPGGIITGETPNTDCLDFRIFKAHWGALHLPRHIMMFNQDNLDRALRRAGFVDTVMRDGLRTIGWTASIQAILADRFGVAIPPSGRVRWYPLLIAAFLPVMIVQKVLGNTATVGFTAHKL